MSPFNDCIQFYLSYTTAMSSFHQFVVCKFVQDIGSHVLSICEASVRVSYSGGVIMSLLYYCGYNVKFPPVCGL